MSRTRFIPPSVDEQGAAAAPPPFLAERTPGGQPNFQRTTLGVRLDETAAGAPTMPVDPRVAELEALREQARQEGITAGLEEARAMAEDEYRGRLQSSQATLERLAVLERTLTEGYRAQVLELTIQMAQAVVQRELADRGAAQALVERAVQAFEEVGRIDAVISPAEQEMMEAWAEQRRGAGLDIHVHVDPELEAGDVQIRSDAGSLSSRLSERFERACAMIRGTEEEADANS